MTDLELLENFRGVSATGENLLLLKAVAQCDCYNPNDLADSEPDPHCEKCMGTGFERMEVKTEKLRYEEQGNASKQTLAIENNGHYTDDIIVIFAPSHYMHIDGKDMFCTLQRDDIECVEKVYHVKNINRYFKDSFVFYEIICKRWIK